MKYVVVDVVVRRGSGGILSVLQDVYQYARKDINNEYIFIVGTSGILQNSKNIRIIVREDLQKSHVRRLWFDFWKGKHYLQKFAPDVLISLQNTAILRVAFPQMVYLHQPIPFVRSYSFSPFKKSERKLFFYQRIAGLAIKANLFLFKQGGITVQTEWMKSEISKYSKAKVFVTKPSISLTDFKNVKGHQNSSHFFFPSTAMIYKNHAALVSAYELLPIELQEQMDLILTITREEFYQLYGQKVTSSHIKFLGRISRRKVIQLLNESILVFPSKVESLGLPLLEAMKLGRPIVASNISPVKEVTNGYSSVQYFDPDNIHDISIALNKAFSMKSPIENLKRDHVDGWKFFFSNVALLSKLDLTKQTQSQDS